MTSLKRVAMLSARDVDSATEQILHILRRHPKANVMYYDGWQGLGASAVLRSIAAKLPSMQTTPGLCFDRILYIDCSEWKSRRAMQRAIAEELKLDSSVMAILDKKDEEDDFRGVGQGSRDVIDSVAAVIDSTLMGTRFMMIFLNGSDDEIDVTIFGIPQFRGFRNNIMIWTFKRRSLTIKHHTSEMLTKLRYSVLYYYTKIRELTNAQFEAILVEEANTIVYQNPCMLDINPTMVTECCLYELFLHYDFHITNKFDWAGHASTFWICDGIIQGDKAWDITNVFHREINWTCDASLLDDFLRNFMRNLESPFLAIKDGYVYKEGPYRWMSVTSRDTELHGMQTIPATVSSFFLAFKTSDHVPSLQDGLFEHSSNKLGVLVLCCCAFNFASPPFLKCHSLRFLGLDHCTDDKATEADDHTGWLCLYNLWVLDLRHTDWNEVLSQEKMDLMTNIRELYIEGVRGWEYTADLQGRLPNLRRLRIIKPICQWETLKDVDNSFTDRTNMEILDFSGNSDMKNLPTSLSKASSLQMLVLDGCDRLEHIGVHGCLPASLKTFSFDGYGPASQRTPSVELPPKHFRPSPTEDEKDISTSKISLEGCKELDNLFLRGLNNLVELDLSGTAIKTLDFNTMVVEVPRLKRLFLIGCKHLIAINKTMEKTDLELICIDTRAGIVCPRPSINKSKSFRLQLHAIVVDARFTRSLRNLLRPYMETGSVKEVYGNIHVTSSPMYEGVVQFVETNREKFDQFDKGSLQQLISAGQYNDVLSMVGFPPMQSFPQPPATRLDRHIEISKGSCHVESALEDYEEGLGTLMVNFVESLHLHDVSLHAIIPVINSWWMHLRWCRLERCPGLDTVFPCGNWGLFELETFWASDLRMARWIWCKGSFYSYSSSFRNLKHLHLHSCPRLQFVLPACVSSFPTLETLHIIHCGDLVHVFPLDKLHYEEIISVALLFPKLTTIHLHDLPKLQKICEVKMVAPVVESIKIRGCWGLRRLPSVAIRPRGAKKPTVEIEKDVWDALEWDANHRPDHFEAPIHSRYYKKKLPRVSFLR